MLHLYKIDLEHSDMFIRGIDLKKNLIEYQILDKQGKAMEPIKKDKFILNGTEVIFDKNRTLHINLINHINQTLN
jgi:hypothetical protein